MIAMDQRSPGCNSSGGSGGSSSCNNRHRLFERRASFDEHEKAFLSALLLDDRFERNGGGGPAFAHHHGVHHHHGLMVEHHHHHPLMKNAVENNDDYYATTTQKRKKVLSNEMLFNVPAEGISSPKISKLIPSPTTTTATINTACCAPSSTTASPASPSPAPNNHNNDHGHGHGKHHHHHVRKRSGNFVGLWKAHEDGVPPAKLKEIAIMKRSIRSNCSTNNGSCHRAAARDDCADSDTEDDDCSSSNRSSSSSCSIRSDEEVRNEKKHRCRRRRRRPSDRNDDDDCDDDCDDDDDDDNSSSSNSTWADEDGGFENYNTWEVLRDEYAADFGFDYNYDNPNNVQSMDDIMNTDYYNNCSQCVFKILGTSATDSTAQPHVLSPPLMESLLNFVPDSLSTDNYWLKFSLIRDGASIETLKRYVRAASDTILAIETTTGQVFGSYTSNKWKTNHNNTNYYGSCNSNGGYYGSGPAFLWKMRHSRQTPCHSLFDQAQMESEIDVYTYSGLNQLLQLCTNDRIAVGGGKLPQQSNNNNDYNHNDYNYDGFDQIHGLNDNNTSSSSTNSNFGFGIAINEDLSSGTSSPCGTFLNPCMCNQSSGKDEIFQIANLEIWTFTPAMDVKSAEKMEMTKYFMEEQLQLQQQQQQLYQESSSISSASTTSHTTKSWQQQQRQHHSSYMSSEDLFQDSFYRRVGKYDENATYRDRWHSSFTYSK